MATKEKAKRKEKVFIDAAKIEALIDARKPALKTEEKKGFVKVTAAEGRRVYVAKTKSVGRVDISGFELPKGTEGIVDLGGLSFGNVHQQVDFAGRTEEQILGTLASVLDHMLTLSPAEKVRKAQPGTVKPQAQAPAAPTLETGSTPADASAMAPAPAAPSSSKKSRKALIEQAAREMGKSISPQTQAELVDAPQS